MAARVLIVEDDFLQAESLEELLSMEGHSVCGTVANGEDAIALARAMRPDVVFMDVKIGGLLDGIDTAELIRWTCPCRLIFLTAHSDKSLVERMRRTQPDAILSKPLTPGAILAEVDRAVAAPWRGASA
jgi:DNA-binding NarL/FixJ family response regulator